MRSGHVFLVVTGVVLWLAPLAGATAITNGDFSAGLAGWTADIRVSDGGGFALLKEDPAFVVAVTTLEQQITIPDLAVALSFEYSLSWTAGGPTGFPLPDGLSASLLDPVTFVPILSMDAAFPGFPDYFFHARSGNTFGVDVFYDPANVSWSASGNVTLDLTSVPGGTDALVVFDLLGGDDGYVTEATVDNVFLSVIPEPVTGTTVVVAVAAIAAYVRRRRLGLR